MGGSPVHLPWNFCHLEHVIFHTMVDFVTAEALYLPSRDGRQDGGFWFEEFGSKSFGSKSFSHR